MTENVSYFPQPASGRSVVRTVLLEPAHDKRVVELAAEWDMTPNQAAARMIACYIEAEADA
jgi:hypothetical protein